jgi:hypothetical protein
LEHEPRVNLHHDRIEGEFTDGVAALSGEVADIAAKRPTLELAPALPVVAGVVDRLHTRVINGLGVEPDEEDSAEEILDALRLVLEDDPLVDACSSSSSTSAG